MIGTSVIKKIKQKFPQKQLGSPIFTASVNLCSATKIYEELTSILWTFLKFSEKLKSLN